MLDLQREAESGIDAVTALDDDTIYAEAEGLSRPLPEVRDAGSLRALLASP
ncbi:MAG: hypothetical protein HYX52_08980 [Chloroflexi bacterium]|nr:hypothetical protein [Chloroflexota bacterium]